MLIHLRCELKRVKYKLLVNNFLSLKFTILIAQNLDKITRIAPPSKRFGNLRWHHQRIYMYYLFTFSLTVLFQQFPPIIECAWILTIISWFESRIWLALWLTNRPLRHYEPFNRLWAPQKTSAFCRIVCVKKRMSACLRVKKWIRRIKYKHLNYIYDCIVLFDVN